MISTRYTVEPRRYEIEEVFNLIGEEFLMRNDANVKHKCDIIVDGFHVHSISLRYMTFYQKGLTCVCCGKQGTHFKLCGDPDTDRRHFNLFSEDGTLITKDHIIPKSRGGQDRVDNMQTMCVDCNLKKGDASEAKAPYIIAVRKTDGSELRFRDIRKAARAVVFSIVPQQKNMSKIADAAISAVLNIQRAVETNSDYAGFFWSMEER